MRWSGGEGSAVELDREHPVPGRPQLGYRVWRPGMDDHLPVTTKRFHSSVFNKSVYTFVVKSAGIHLQ